MKIIDTFQAKNNDMVRLVSEILSDDSIVFDIHICCDTGDYIYEINAYDEKDAYKRFDHLKKALLA